MKMYTNARRRRYSRRTIPPADNALVIEDATNGQLADKVRLIIDLKQGRRFKKRPYGVAWYYSRPLIEHPDDFDSPEEADDHWSDMSRGICGCPESGDWFYGIMVGDDTEYPIDFDDVELIDDDDYCGSCGQIGCSHG